MLMDRHARCARCTRAFAGHCGKLTHLEGSGLLDGGVRHKGGACLGGGSNIDLGGHDRCANARGDSRRHVLEVRSQAR